MDRGFTIENPYASVAIPQAQLKDDFLSYYLGEDFNPNVLGSCSATPQKEADPKSPSLAWNGQAQVESQASPINPYASLKAPPRVDAPEPFHWKSHEEAAPDPGGGCRCCRCCCCSPCCRKCCCVIS